MNHLKTVKRILIDRRFTWLIPLLAGWLPVYAQLQVGTPMNPKRTVPEQKGYQLVFNEDFTGTKVDTTRWIPYYLPHWSSRERAKPRYTLENGYLHLQITPDQQPWCPEFNGAVRCSSLQTGLFAGPVGSPIGQHKINPACVVRQAQPMQQTYVPTYGYVEIRARWAAGPTNVAALWMIGFEDRLERSAEICVVELKGKNVKPTECIIGYGMHAFGDPTLREAFYEEPFAVDVSQFHVYAVKWTPGQVTFLLDNQPIRVIRQSPAYPMQLMLSLYDVPIETEDTPVLSPTKDFVVDYVRGYSLP